MEVPRTELTLLARLRDHADDVSWRRFEALYRDLVVRFALRRGVQAADAEDVAQAVFVSLASALRGYAHDPARGRFRDYLFRAVRNELLRAERRRRRPTEAVTELPQGGLDELPDRSIEDPDARAAFEEEWLDHHYRMALVEIRATHSAETVAIFDRLVRGTSVEETAALFATTPAAVHKVKQRLRDRMKEIIERQIAEEGW